MGGQVSDYGDPRCDSCRGKGYIHVWGRVQRCGCVRPTPQVTALTRQANARPGQPFMSLGDMVQRYGSQNKGR